VKLDTVTYMSNIIHQMGFSGPMLGSGTNW